MEFFQTMHDKNGVEIENMCMILSHLGVLYYANISTGLVKWGRNLNISPYQPFQQRDVVKYIDIGDDRVSPCLYSSGSKKGILMNGNQVLLSKDGFKETTITNDTDEIFLTQDGVVSSKEGDETMFTITRTEWCFIGSDWSLRYSNIDVVDKNKRVCIVHYARTAEQFAELCHRLGLRDSCDDGFLTRAINAKKNIHLVYPKEFVAHKKILSNGDIICYLKGRLTKSNVFVKRSRSKEVLSRLRNSYPESSDILSVVKLLLVESDGDFNYFAFEDFGCNLASFIKEQEFVPRVVQLDLLREIVKALCELHANDVYHHNFAPESVLVKKYDSTGRYVVKLCGMGDSKWCTSSEFNEDKYYTTEICRFARTILMLMTSGIHIFSESKHPSRCRLEFKGFDTDLERAGVLVADLIKKLTEFRISIPEVLSHAIFWDPPRCVYFLKDMSDQIIQKKYQDIDLLSSTAFGGDWSINTQQFKAWFEEMEKIPDYQKVSADQSIADENMPDHDDKAKKNVYVTTSLRSLLRFIRNTANHPRKTYPGDDIVALHGYIMNNYPNLLRVVYNYMIDNAPPNSRLYKEYAPKKILY